VRGRWASDSGAAHLPHLTAQGPHPQNRWRRRLESGRGATIGRAAGLWTVPWDDRVSRQHAVVRLVEGRLQVRRLPGARNPLFFRGQSCDECTLEVGEHFVIGSTVFSFVQEGLELTFEAPLPVTELAFSREALRTTSFRHAAQLIEALTRLPDIIAGSSSDEELSVQLVNVLFRGIASATCVALVASQDTLSPAIEVLHWDRPAGSTTTPSERLIQRAREAGETVVHVWGDERESALTQQAETAWAFCTPIRGQACQGWAIYVAGTRRVADPADLHDEVKFAELVALTVANLRDLRQLERHKSALGQFISPVVLEAVARQDPDRVLAPRETDVSVLFCDLRGFSLQSERAGKDLMGLLHRVSMALGVMTRHILAQEGVIGDFHGDSAMGFWGWPLGQPRCIAQACQAALGIHKEFAAAQAAGHPLADFRVGIGLATGRAVAGKIGSADQVKITVFGPVVNLASRLEEMTKFLRAPILIDEATALHVRREVSPELARVRRVARIRPYGMESAVEVSQLLPPAHDSPLLSDEDIASYEAALDALQARQWERAFELLHAVPAEDRVKDFLTIFIAQNNRLPPQDWDGVIPLSSK
jgi:adenylate cyclase